MLKTTSLIALSAALGFASLAEAQTIRERLQQRAMDAGVEDYVPLDANGDNQITRAEYDAFLRQRYALIDTNGDGITQSELTAAQNEAQARRAAARAQGQQAAGRIRGELEARGVDVPEVETPNLDAYDPELTPAQRQAAVEAAARNAFNQQDANRDGVISEAEYVNARADRFNEADANGDGVVTGSEAEALARRLRAEIRSEVESRQP